MGAVGRNDRCPCGSGRKVKRCCGVRTGPSEAELAKAFLAVQARAAAPVLAGFDEEDLDELWDRLFDLPLKHLSLLVAFSDLLTPEIDRLRRGMAADDLEEVNAALPAVLSRHDTPQVRAQLARGVLVLGDCGDIESELAAAALADLAGPSGALLRASLLHSAAVAVGVERTPAGLVLASH